MALIDLTGQTFGRLKVLGLHPERNRFGQAQWWVKCECGESEKFLIIGNTMKSGNTTSCGCLRREKTGNKFRKHGLYGTPEYTAWIEINRRCYNENCSQYMDYGGRGITVSNEWKNDFTAFLKDMGLKPSAEHTIDRIDNDGNYEKGNCRWATRIVQANNTSQNVHYEYAGEKYTIAQIAKKFKMPYATMRMRLLYLPVEAAVDKNIRFETYVLKIDGKEKPMKDWLRFAGITLDEYVGMRREGLSAEAAILKGFDLNKLPIPEVSFDAFIALAESIVKDSST